MAFNLNKRSTIDVFSLQLRDPDTDELLFEDAEKKKPIIVEIYGPGSAAYKNAVLALQNRQLKRGKKVMTAELLREEGTELLATAIAGSSGNIEYNGEIVKTKEQWVELLSDSSLEWLRDQINTAQNDLSNFLPK
jgi:hypothetical protein